ncbi:MAG TPA: nucleotidyltransferase family protein [Armatimonadota bacterium]|jgi:molybdenum cofactor cytidylyltransferase
MTTDTGGDCGAVVLAAGAARRFGRPKLLMPFGESTVVGSVVRALASAGVAPIVVVAGAEIEGIRLALAGEPVKVVCNASPDDGMLSSIRAGLEALPAVLGRFLVVLGDQPRIRGEDISRLIREHAASGSPVTIPVVGGKRGHPVVFIGAYRRRILDLADGLTLRDLMEAHRDDIIEVPCDFDAYVRDIDTREDYEHELRQWHAER